MEHMYRIRLRNAAMTLGLAACMCPGCNRQNPESLPVTVRAKTLGPEKVASSMLFSASVEPRQKVDLAFKVPGTVDHLLRLKAAGSERDVQEGDVVAKGEIIAELELRDFQREVELGQARLDRALTAIQAAQASADFARKEFERIKGLMEQESAAKREFDEIRTRRDGIEAQLTGAQKEAAGASVALAQAKDRLADCTLRVPIDCATVVRKAIEPKERVMPGQIVFRIMDMSTVHVEFGVPDTMLGSSGQPGDASSKVVLGRELTVSAEAFEGERFQGRITKIAPAANPNTRTFLTEVTLDNRTGKLKPGMIVTVRIGEEKQAVLAPMTAIQRGEKPGEMAVFKVEMDNGKACVRRRKVNLGGLYNNQVELLTAGSEVKVGDRVVVTGAWRLDEGKAVRLLEEGEERSQP
jgi:RND family efflux transporter MFP subunit